MALESIAARYAGSSMTEHVLDVGSECRIGVDVLAKLARADAELHCEAKDVDKLVTGMADEVSPENTVAGTIHDDLRPGDCFGVGPRRKPIAHIVDMDFCRQALRFQGGLGQADSSKSRHRIDRGSNACVVGTMLQSVDDIAADEIAFVGRDRRQLGRGRNGIATDEDARIGGRAQIPIGDDAAIVVLDLTAGEAERIDISDATAAVDDPVGFGRMFGALVGKEDAEPTASCLDSLDPNTCPDL